MSTISINRPLAYFGIYRKLIVWVDSQKVGEIKTKECFDYVIPEGEHSIQVSMDWCKSKRVNIKASKGENLHFSVKTQAIWFSIFTCFFLPSKVFSVNLESKI